MIINGPISLWKDYDVSALPLNTSVFSDKTENGVHVKEFYFDGYTTVDGRVRTYIKISEREDALGVVLVVPDKDGNDGGAAQSLYENGFSVAVLDYLGERDDNPAFTHYPKSLSELNSRGKTEFAAPADPLYSRWYIWTCLARKACLLLRTEYPDKKLFAYGIGLGGGTVYRLCAVSDALTAAATALNIRPKVSGSGNEMINYRGALDPNAYSTITKTPLFMAAASNDEDGSLDEVAELAAATASLKCFRIVERALKSGIEAILPQLGRFFKSYIDGEPVFYRPIVSPKNSENNLYFNIEIKSDSEKPFDGEQKFYVAFCVEQPLYRNWTNIKSVKIGDGESIAKVIVLNREKPLYAFMNLTDKDGNVSSSQVVCVNPKSMGIEAQQAVLRRLIYSESMGTDVWASMGGGKPEMAEGPLGIKGITSKSHTLITFKPSDILYKVKNDVLLQLIISGKQQTIKITINTQTDRFVCERELSDDNNWHKITLTSADFKSENGQTIDFSNALMFKVSGDAEFMISSIVWV